MIGNSVALACREARTKLDKEIAAVWGVEQNTISAVQQRDLGRGHQFPHVDGARR